MLSLEQDHGEQMLVWYSVKRVAKVDVLRVAEQPASHLFRVLDAKNI